jgi:hypothetical protein
VFGPEVLRDAEKQFQMIRENLKVAQSCQKSYANKRKDLSFEIGDFVYLKVSPMRGTRRFKVKGKANSEICRSIQDHQPQGRSCLSTRVSASTVRRT